MEPQMDVPNAPQNNPAGSPEDALGSYIKTRRYRLVALVPLLIGIMVYPVRFIFPEADVIPILAVFGGAFILNYFLPFATTARRAFFACVPFLVLSGAVMIVVTAYSYDHHYLVMLIPMTCAALLVANALLAFFSWLGAKIGSAAGRGR